MKRWKSNNRGKVPGRQVFVECFTKAWPNWVTSFDIRNAFKLVGWTLRSPGVEVSLFPDDHELFVLAASIRVRQPFSLFAHGAQARCAEPEEDPSYAAAAVEGSASSEATDDDDLDTIQQTFTDLDSATHEIFALRCKLRKVKEVLQATREQFHSIEKIITPPRAEPAEPKERRTVNVKPTCVSTQTALLILADQRDKRDAEEARLAAGREQRAAKKEQRDRAGQEASNMREALARLGYIGTATVILIPVAALKAFLSDHHIPHAGMQNKEDLFDAVKTVLRDADIDDLHEAAAQPVAPEAQAD